MTSCEVCTLLLEEGRLEAEVMVKIMKKHLDVLHRTMEKREKCLMCQGLSLVIRETETFPLLTLKN